MDQPELVISERGLVGWRAWKLVKPYFLLSLGGQCMWMPGERLVAECEMKNFSHPGIDAPVMACTCGIYAHKIEEQIAYKDVWGEVYLWGQVKEYDSGYRAQYAYIKQLFVVPELAHLVPILSGSFGVPVTVKERRSPALQTRRERNNPLNVLNKQFTAKAPTPAQFLEYHPGYKRFYELCQEHGVDTSYDDRIARGLGRSVKTYHTFNDGTEDILLKLMKCADRTTLGYGSRSGHKPYRFHFFTRFAPSWNIFKEITV